MKKYPPISDGEWVAPHREHKEACCHCGLVHRVEYRIVKTAQGNQIQYRAFQDKRATAGVRRGLKTKGLKLRLPSV